MRRLCTLLVCLGLSIVVLAQSPTPSQVASQAESLWTRFTGYGSSISTSERNDFRARLDALKAEILKLQAAPTPPPTQPPGTWKCDFWNTGTGEAPALPSGPPVATQYPVSLNFDWGSGSPGAPVAADHFVMACEKSETFAAGSHVFTGTADDGLRLFLDGVSVLERWIDQEATAYATTQTFSASGSHLVRFVMYENGGDAVAKLTVAPVTAPAPTPPPGPTPVPPPSGQALLQANEIVYTGCFWDWWGNGSSSAAAQGLAGRSVNGDFRLTFWNWAFVEVSLAGLPCGSMITTPTRSWPASGASDFVGLSFVNGALVLSTVQDYPNDTYVPPAPTQRVLNDTGTVGPVTSLPLTLAASRRIVFGTVHATPTAWQTAYGFKPWLSLSGGYLSRATFKSVSYGPTIYSFDSTGVSIAHADFPDVFTQRGIRLPVTTNYHDGGDLRPNGSNGPRPTSPPAAGARFLCTAPGGNCYFSAADSYYGASFLVDTPTRKGIVMLASVAKGYNWYCNSTICTDARQVEAHVFDPGQLAVPGVRQPWQVVPSSMQILPLPGIVSQPMTGNTPQGNASGAVFDPVSGKAYVAGGDPFAGHYRIWELRVTP